jgi:hypothetical protein
VEPADGAADPVQPTLLIGFAGSARQGEMQRGGRFSR